MRGLVMLSVAVVMREALGQPLVEFHSSYLLRISLKSAQSDLHVPFFRNFRSRLAQQKSPFGILSSLFVLGCVNDCWRWVGSGKPLSLVAVLGRHLLVLLKILGLLAVPHLVSWSMS